MNRDENGRPAPGSGMPLPPRGDYMLPIEPWRHRDCGTCGARAVWYLHAWGVGGLCLCDDCREVRVHVMADSEPGEALPAPGYEPRRDLDPLQEHRLRQHMQVNLDWGTWGDDTGPNEGRAYALAAVLESLRDCGVPFTPLTLVTATVIFLETAGDRPTTLDIPFNWWGYRLRR